MNILYVVGGLPTEEKPFYQPFIKSQIDSVKRAGINTTILDLKGYDSPLNYLKKGELLTIVEKQKIDLIHSHYSYTLIPVLLSKVKIPTIVSLMGSDLLGSPDGKGNIRFRGKFDKLLTRFLIRKANAIIVKSNEMKERLKVNKQIYVIPNGVNFNHFKLLDKNVCRNELILSNDKFLVLFLGNPELKRKNFALAKASVERLKEIYDKKDVELVVPFGASHDTIVKYFNACDVLLVTSFIEGSPNVVKEAMACNLPIISTDVGDVREVISDTRNCFIVSFNSEEIAQRLKIIYDNRTRTNGREKIEHLRDDRIAEKLIQIYEKTITSHEY